MSTATMTDPNTMEIQGREICRRLAKDRSSGETYWRYLEVRPAYTIEDEHFDPRIGAMSRRMVHVGEKLLWEHCANHAGKLATLDEQVATVEFDARIPSPLHDEMDRALAAGFEAWGAMFAASHKLRPRPQLEGRLFDVGNCRSSRKLPFDVITLRAMVHRHQRGDHGVHGDVGDVELTEAMRFCPAIFGVLACNAVAIEAGEGLIVSRYGAESVNKYGETRAEDVGVCTLLSPRGPETRIWSINRDTFCIQ